MQRSVGGSAYASLRYDPLGRLYETVGSTTGTTRFLHDGDDLVAEYDGSGTLLRRYVHGDGADQPLVWFEGSGVSDSARRYLYADERGSIVGVTDSSGNMLGIDSYDEQGIPAFTNIGRFGYTGQAWIPELGMYYYKARMYSPSLGRFMQTDPIGYGDGMNMYAYVHGDAVNGTDPSGLDYNPDTHMYTCLDGSSHEYTGQVGPGPCDGFRWGQGGAGDMCAYISDFTKTFPCEWSDPTSCLPGCLTNPSRTAPDTYDPTAGTGGSGFGGGGDSQAGWNGTGTTGSDSSRPQYCGRVLHQRGQAFEKFGGALSLGGTVAIGALLIAGAPLTGVVGTVAIFSIGLGTTLSYLGNTEQALAGDNRAAIRAGASLVSGGIFSSLTTTTPIAENFLSEINGNWTDWVAGSGC